MAKIAPAHCPNFVISINSDLQMKGTVLITGANKSIGFETARQLLQQGYFVYIGSRDIEKGQAAVAALQSDGYQDVDTVQLDVTDPDSVSQAFEVVAAKTGRLEVLINNAGVPGAIPQNASEVGSDNIRRVFETNFFGVIQTTQTFLPLLRKSANPRIVNVSSDLGSLANHSNPDYEFYHVKIMAYASSKTALNAFTVMLAYELGPEGFRVNSVNPGYTATDFNHHSGYKSVSEGAEVIVRYATIDGDGPNGKFFSDYGETAW